MDAKTLIDVLRAAEAGPRAGNYRSLIDLLNVICNEEVAARAKTLDKLRRDITENTEYLKRAIKDQRGGRCSQDNLVKIVAANSQAVAFLCGAVMDLQATIMELARNP